VVSARPSYLKYAFGNVYNLSLLGGAATASLLTGDWAPALVGGALEALWLFVGADSAPFRRWVDRKHAERLREESRAARRERIGALARTDQERASGLVALHAEMGTEIDKHEDWSGQLVGEEYGRLESLLDSFVELAGAADRFERYCRDINAAALRGELEQQRRRAERTEDAEAAALARRNVDLLQRRIEALEEMDRIAARARGQMSVIENTFRLLRDQVVSLRPPDDIKNQIDEISAGVEAVRSVLAESDQRIVSAVPERGVEVSGEVEKAPALASVAVAPPPQFDAETPAPTRRERKRSR
jgi:hypothetical protein